MAHADTLTALDVESGVKGQELRPVVLKTARDFVILKTALEHRKLELDKLVKKNREEGYDREARTMEGDANAIEYHILPQVRPQQELALGNTKELIASIADAVRDTVRTNIVVQDERGKLDRNKTRAIEEVSSVVGRKVAAFAEAVAVEAFAAGYAARENDPAALAKRALSALYEL